MSDADSLKREIFEKIAEFYRLEHGEQPFIPGQTKIHYAGRVYDQREMITLCYRRRDWKEYRKTTQGQAMADPSPFFKLWDLSETEQQKTFEVMAEWSVPQYSVQNTTDSPGSLASNQSSV